MHVGVKPGSELETAAEYKEVYCLIYFLKLMLDFRTGLATQRHSTGRVVSRSCRYRFRLNFQNGTWHLRAVRLHGCRLERTYVARIIGKLIGKSKLSCSSRTYNAVTVKQCGLFIIVLCQLILSIFIAVVVYQPYCVVNVG